MFVHFVPHLAGLKLSTYLRLTGQHFINPERTLLGLPVTLSRVRVLAFTPMTQCGISHDLVMLEFNTTLLWAFYELS